MNSKLINYLYITKFKSTKKVFSEIQARSIGKLPILIYHNQKPFVVLADYIILLNKMPDEKIINEYVLNSHIVQVFEEVINAMVYELYFEKDFRDVGIEFIKYVERDFESMEGKDENQKIEIVQNAYQKLREKDNEIRNNLKLMDIKLADLIGLIKNGK